MGTLFFTQILNVVEGWLLMAIISTLKFKCSQRMAIDGHPFVHSKFQWSQMAAVNAHPFLNSNFECLQMVVVNGHPF